MTINLASYAGSLWNAVLAGAGALALYLFLSNWGMEFKYPLLRSPVGRTGLVIAVPAATEVFTYYILTGYLILFGLSYPLLTDSGVSLNPFDLAIVGLLLVALIRILTLLHSAETHRTLLDALVLSAGFGFYLAFQYPQVITDAVLAVINASPGAFPDRTTTLVLPLLAFALAAVAELTWAAFVFFRPMSKRQVPASFVDASQEAEATESIGYTRKQIHQAYLQAVEDVASKEAIWEILWLTSLGAESDFYRKLVDCTAARIAVDANALNSFDRLSFLPPNAQAEFRSQAKNQLKARGLFMMDEHSTVGIRKFDEEMGFNPGLVAKAPNVRFMILNRRLMVMSWPAHPQRYAFGRRVPFRSTMCARSEDPARIDYHVRYFQSLWEQYQLTHMGGLMHDLSSGCLTTIGVIISRSGSWTMTDLQAELILRGIQVDPNAVEDNLRELIDRSLIVTYPQGQFSRDANSYSWQERWLRMHHNAR